MDVLRQNRIVFTAPQPHVIHPSDERFAGILSEFAATCRVVNGTRGMRVGSLGARTSAFKTVRFDEGTAQAAGITVETMDMSSIFAQMRAIDPDSPDAVYKLKKLTEYSVWDGVPGAALTQITCLGVVLDNIIRDQGLHALALRCWVEFQEQLGISPCVILSMLNNAGVPAACEVDVGNAIMMRMLGLASEEVTTCLDWNNNYGEEEDKCILFHCGPVPQTMMTDTGIIRDHAILANAVGAGNGFGCNTGRIKPGPFTYGSLLTEDGKIMGYVGEGVFTDDVIPDNFFGCAGVAQIPDLQKILQTIGYAGHRHHTSATPGHISSAIEEAFIYLGEPFRLMSFNK
jgi:L-fucose isomerase-like protein